MLDTHERPEGRRTEELGAVSSGITGTRNLPGCGGRMTASVEPGVECVFEQRVVVESGLRIVISHSIEQEELRAFGDAQGAEGVEKPLVQARLLATTRVVGLLLPGYPDPHRFKRSTKMTSIVAVSATQSPRQAPLQA